MWCDGSTGAGLFHPDRSCIAPDRVPRTRRRTGLFPAIARIDDRVVPMRRPAHERVQFDMFRAREHLPRADRSAWPGAALSSGPPGA